MENCTQCGAVWKPGSRFCTECGAAAPVVPNVPASKPSAAQHIPVTSVQQPVYQTAAASDVPPAGSRYELISAGGYIGISLLMCIPVLGLILTVIWACGGCRKLQKRNFARAALIMMVIALVISLILGFAAKKLIDHLQEEAGVTAAEDDGGLFGGIRGDKEKESDGLSGLIGGRSGKETAPGGSSELDELQNIINQLEGLTGEDMGGDELVGEIEKINEEAAAHADGWPSDLPGFPSGTMKQVEEYRTEFTGTTMEDTTAYIETLKDMGYEYQDFYDMGMSEADMLEFGGWWGYNGNWYLSISYSEGVTIIDHMTELPDLSALLG